jgi:hypothetical protein
MTLSFHIRHEVRPDRTKDVFVSIANCEPDDHVIQAGRQLHRLRQLGLIDKTELSELGKTIFDLCQSNPNLWGDLLHYVQYTLWNEKTPDINGFSWTYRFLSNYMWRYAIITRIDHKFFEPVVSSLINEAEASNHFDIEQTRKATVSLSGDSLNGGRYWLESLMPPVIENDVFTRRHFCPPELLLLAVGWVAQQTEGELGIDFLLTPARREMICQLCLLDPSALDRVLDWSLPLYPNVMVAGTNAGVYGRFLRFLKWPELSDLLRS